MFTCLAWQGLIGDDHDKTKAGSEFYKKNGAKYNNTHQFTISILSDECPF